MSHSYTLQLHTGSFTDNLYSFEAIKKKTEPLFASLQIKDILLGWSVDKALNQKLLDYFHEKGVRVFLWFPALAEGEQVRELTAITNASQKQGAGIASKHEHFQFACPSNLSNVHSMISIYEEYFQDLPFDGVFLDKVRFPSFANGYEEGFGCFCEHCEKQMFGIDLTYIKTLIQDHDERLLRGDYDDYGIYHFEDPMVHAFYRRRANIISDYVFKLAAYFNSRKMIVGADLYAPFFAYHVGQNTKDIGKLVDFVKPMLYRYTNAPAGIRYEYEAYQNCFPNKEIFAKHWDHDPASDASIRKQAEFLSNIPALVYAGIEINPIQGICDTDKEKVSQTLSLLSDFSTIALSWDIMQMDEDILTIL